MQEKFEWNEEFANKEIVGDIRNIIKIFHDQEMASKFWFKSRQNYSKIQNMSRIFSRFSSAIWITVNRRHCLRIVRILWITRIADILPFVRIVGIVCDSCDSLALSGNRMHRRQCRRITDFINESQTLPPIRKQYLRIVGHFRDSSIKSVIGRQGLLLVWNWPRRN